MCEKIPQLAHNGDLEMVTVYRENTLSKQFEMLFGRDRADNPEQIRMKYTHEIRTVTKYPASEFQITPRPKSLLKRAQSERDSAPVGVGDIYEHLLKKLQSIEDECGPVLAILK